MKKLLFFAFFYLGALCACAPQPVYENWNAITGSKSDATVTLAINYLPGQEPEYSIAQAFDIAAQKCANWGYDSAEPFGSPVSQCVSTQLAPTLAGPPPPPWWVGPGFAGPPPMAETTVCAQYQLTYEFQCANGVPLVGN